MNSRSFMKHFLRAETHRNLSPNKFNVQNRLVKLPLATKYPEWEGGAECRLMCQFPLFLKQIPGGFFLAYNHSCRMQRTTLRLTFPKAVKFILNPYLHNGSVINRCGFPVFVIQNEMFSEWLDVLLRVSQGEFGFQVWMLLHLKAFFGIMFLGGVQDSWCPQPGLILVSWKGWALGAWGVFWVYFSFCWSIRPVGARNPLPGMKYAWEVACGCCLQKLPTEMASATAAAASCQLLQ